MERYDNTPKGIFKERRKYEMLDGKIYFMARPSANHNSIVGNISRIFGNYLRGKKCRMFLDGMDVKFNKKDTTVPDVMIVSNKDIIKKNGIHGAPDLIVEVLSPSTAEHDIGYKKDLYEKYGVKEYWIVSQAERSIQVYLLKDGGYELDRLYQIYDEEYVLEVMDEEERNAIIKEFKTSLYDDLIISVEEVFENVEL
jgi:Uma2 family endonuclease